MKKLLGSNSVHALRSSSSEQGRPTAGHLRSSIHIDSAIGDWKLEKDSSES